MEQDMEQEAPKKTGGIIATVLGLIGLGGTAYSVKGSTQAALEKIALDPDGEIAKKFLAEEHSVGKVIKELNSGTAPVDVIGSLQDNIGVTKLASTAKKLEEAHLAEIAELGKNPANAAKIGQLTKDFEANKAIFDGRLKSLPSVEGAGKKVEENLKALGEKLGKLDKAKLAWGGMSGTKQGLVVAGAVVSLGAIAYGVSRIVGKHTQKVEEQRAAAQQQGMGGTAPAIG